jgi:hypothetical protein
VDVFTITDDRVEEGAALLAADIVGMFFAKEQEGVLSVGDAQLASLDSSKGLERRSCRSATVRAMTIQRVLELVLHRVLNGSAQALAGEYAACGTPGCGVHDV